MTPHLTQPPGTDLNAAMSATPPGMAWIEGTGPAGETCRSCTHWRRGARPAYDVRTARSTVNQHHTGELKPKPCEMYSKLMLRGALDVVGAPVPADARACRHFETFDGEPAPLKFKVYEAAREKAKAERKEQRRIEAAKTRREKKLAR